MRESKNKRAQRELAAMENPELRNFSTADARPYRYQKLAYINALHLHQQVERQRALEDISLRELASRLYTQPGATGRFITPEGLAHTQVRQLFRLADALDVALLIEFVDWREVDERLLVLPDLYPWSIVTDKEEQLHPSDRAEYATRAARYAKRVKTGDELKISDPFVRRELELKELFAKQDKVLNEAKK